MSDLPYVYARCRFADVWDELIPLNIEQWVETEMQVRKKPINIDKAFYEAAQEAGTRELVGCIHETEGLVGVLSICINEYAPHNGESIALDDYIYVVADHRGHGIAGDMIDYGVHILREMGVDRFIMGSRHVMGEGHPSLGGVLADRGFEPISVIYSLDLSED